MRKEIHKLYYNYLLFDLDHTLLDFDAAEEVALTRLLEESGVKDVQTYKNFYIPMNKQMWEDLTLKRISKKELVSTRFSRLFAHFDQEVDGREYADFYQELLSQQGQILAGADDLLVNLSQQGYHIFGATNGITRIQEGRMAHSGIETFFEHVFISDKIGFQKPDTSFYTHIAQNISNFDRKKALMIGDSLIADVQGGNNAGIDTVWYNPETKTKTNTTKALPTYTVKDYQALSNLLN